MAPVSSICSAPRHAASSVASRCPTRSATSTSGGLPPTRSTSPAERGRYRSTGEPVGDGLGDRTVAALPLVAGAVDPHEGDRAPDRRGVRLQLLGRAEGVLRARDEQAGLL